CAVDVFLRRRFTESEDSPANTSIGLQVRLLTLGSSERRDSLLGSSSFGDFRRSSLSGAAIGSSEESDAALASPGGSR
ncbi:MAG: hypothetical protein AAFV49_06395, partial [Pseudomonadota bacterium]